jgi:opine dehydrogenase
MEASMQTIAVLGAGNSGLAMSAHLAISGHRVRLWNRSAENISRLIETKVIHCSGVIEGDAKLELVTSDINKALDGVSLILITTPANSHRDIAEKIAASLTEEKTIILNPGRTFGAIEVEYILSRCKPGVKPILAETQTIIYTCRKMDEDSVTIYSLKEPVLLAARNREGTLKVLAQLPDCLKNLFIPAKSLIETSLGNVGAVLHSVPVLFNSGWIENNKVDFKYYYDGITPTIGRYLERLDNERLSIAEKLGVKLESVTEWMKRSYKIEGQTLFECIQNNEAYRRIDAPRSLRHRYIFEDIPCGLVAFESLGKLLNIEMSVIPKTIDLATELLEFDFRANGRTLERLGLADATAETIIQKLS